MKFLFIADFFAEHIKGGAELCDKHLINSLQELGHEVIKVRSHELGMQLLNGLENYKIIVSNFVNLNEKVKNYIALNKDYIIYEHDHKYLNTRNPSVFENNKAPEECVINKDFYRSARKVIAQSELHKNIMKKNLQIENITFSGVSFWSDQEFSFLEKLNSSEYLPEIYMDGCFVLDSDISHKGTFESVRYCEENNKKYVLCRGEWNCLMKQLKGSDGLVFFPQTIETMSRLVLEARMLNVPIKCNKKIGAIHEEWFGKYKGNDLISYLREKKNSFVDEVVAIFEQKVEKALDKEDITVILNLYRRPQNLREQVEVIRNQSVKPKEIWLWINQHDDQHAFLNNLEYPEYNPIGDTNYACEMLGVDKIIDCSHNFKFYGRYAGALLADTKYVAIFDDDTVPGHRWFENCLNTMEKSPGILGSAGVILRSNTYNPHTRVGWPNPNDKVERVDLVGHASFFERGWLGYLWLEKPPTWDNGEDIQFSYAAQKYGNIQTYVPPHPLNDKSMWGSIKGNELGIDEVASSNNKQISHKQFFSERDMCVSESLSKGWNICNENTSSY